MMRYWLLFILIIALCSSCIAADMNVTVKSIGKTYIEWQWDPGYDISHIMLDGIEICGYETTNNSLISSGLSPNSLHSINVSNDTNFGDASATTLPEAIDYTSDATAASFGVVGGLVTSVLILKRRSRT